jgi:polar amino acid transport system substrate-binding protein
MLPKRHLLWLLLAPAMLLAVDSLAAKAPTLRVSGSIWSPYIDQTLESYGLASEIVSTALRRAGYEIEPTVEPWTRAYQGASLGVYDVLAAVWQTDSRAREMLFSEPYFFNDIVLIARAGPRMDSIEDLRGRRVGVVEGYAYGGGFDENRDIIRVRSNHLVQNLLLLRQGKIDAVVGDSYSIIHAITKYMPDAVSDWVLIPQPVARRALYAGASKQNPDAAGIIANFNKAIKEMREDGTYNEIVGRHTKDYVLMPGKH